MTIKRGTITGFAASWQSGIAFIEIDGIPYPCDNGPTVRALDACFEGFITEGHTVDARAIIGKEIVFAIEDLGIMLEGFAPIEDWKGPEIPLEGIEEEELEEVAQGRGKI